MTAAAPRPCPGPHDLDPTHVTPPAVWCRRCATTIAHRLADLDDQVALLEAGITGHRPQVDGDAPITGSRGTGSPSPAVDLVDEITRTLEHHEAAYRDHHGWARGPARPAEHRVLTCTAWLARHLDGLLAGPDGETAGHDITRLHRAARLATSTAPARRRLRVPCRRCDTRALEHEAGADYVACGHCGRLMTMTEADEWTAEYAAANARRTA